MHQDKGGDCCWKCVFVTNTVWVGLFIVSSCLPPVQSQSLTLLDLSCASHSTWQVATIWMMAPKWEQKNQEQSEFTKFWDLILAYLSVLDSVHLCDGWGISVCSYENCAFCMQSYIGFSASLDCILHRVSSVTWFALQTEKCCFITGICLGSSVVPSNSHSLSKLTASQISYFLLYS